MDRGRRPQRLTQHPVALDDHVRLEQLGTQLVLQADPIRRDVEDHANTGHVGVADGDRDRVGGGGAAHDQAPLADAAALDEIERDVLVTRDIGHAVARPCAQPAPGDVDAGHCRTAGEQQRQHDHNDRSSAHGPPPR